MKKSQPKTNGVSQPAERPSIAKAGELLTRAEVALRWHCCGHTVARRRDLQPIRLGARLLRYRLEDVVAVESAAR